MKNILIYVDYPFVVFIGKNELERRYPFLWIFSRLLLYVLIYSGISEISFYAFFILLLLFFFSKTSVQVDFYEFLYKVPEVVVLTKSEQFKIDFY